MLQILLSRVASDDELTIFAKHIQAIDDDTPTNLKVRNFFQIFY